MKLGKLYMALRPNGNGSRQRAELFDGTMLDKAEKFATDGGTLPGRVVAVDVDSLPPASATEAEQHESQFVYHYAALQAVRPDANPEDAVARELVRLRGENERMRVVCERATALLDGWGKHMSPNNPRDVGLLSNAVDAFRSHAQPQPRAVATLTTQEREAMFQMRERVLAASGSVSITFYGSHIALVSAIDKLLGGTP